MNRKLVYLLVIVATVAAVVLAADTATAIYAHCDYIGTQGVYGCTVTT